MGPDYPLTDLTRAKAQALGPRGEAWLAALPQTVSAVCARFGFAPEASLPGGSAALVLAGRQANGEGAVLKLPLPELESAAAERMILTAAAGRGYPCLFAIDEGTGALLMERLGGALDTLGLAPEAMEHHLLQTLAHAWRVAADPDVLPTGEEKAASLAAMVRALAKTVRSTPPTSVIAAALACARLRAGAFIPDNAIVAHGDAHAANALADPGSGGLAFKLVDPEGLFAERAYDLGVILRTAAPARVRPACDAFAARTGEPAEAIWQWAFLERVSTGLYLQSLGAEEEGAGLIVGAEAVLADPLLG